MRSRCPARHQENRARHTRIRMSGERTSSRRLGCFRNVIGRGRGQRRRARRGAPDAWTSRLSIQLTHHHAHTSVGTQGGWARQGGTALCKDVIHVQKRLKHREPGPQHAPCQLETSQQRRLSRGCFRCPPPPPARPSVSPSSETGGHDDCCACGGLSSAATTRHRRADFASAAMTRDGRADFASTVRNASHSVDRRLQRAENIAE